MNVLDHYKIGDILTMSDNSWAKLIGDRRDAEGTRAHPWSHPLIVMGSNGCISNYSEDGADTMSATTILPPVEYWYVNEYLTHIGAHWYSLQAAQEARTELTVRTLKIAKHPHTSIEVVWERGDD